LRCCKSKRSPQAIVVGVETYTGNGESEGVIEELINPLNSQLSYWSQRCYVF